MAENEFMNGVRIEQFIKSNNEQIKDSINTLNVNMSTNVKTIITNQKTQITSLKSIDKSTKSIDKSILSILSVQDKMLKALSGKTVASTSQDKLVKDLSSRDKSRNDSQDKLLKGLDSVVSKIGSTDSKSDNITDALKGFAKSAIMSKLGSKDGTDSKSDNITDALKGFAKSAIMSKLGSGSKEKSSTYQQDKTNYDKSSNKLLGSMTDSLGVLSKKTEDRKGGFLRSLMMGIGGVFAGGGLIGYLLTGKRVMLNNVAKGLNYSLKGAGSIGKGIMTIFGTIGDIAKGAGTLIKLVKRFGIKKGAMVGARTMGKTMAKGGGKAAVKKIPVIGAIMGIVFGIQKFRKGDVVGGLLEIASGAASILPGLGTAASIAIDLYSMKRDFTMTDADKTAETEQMTSYWSSPDGLKKIPGIGTMVYMREGIELWKSGKKKEALKSFMFAGIPGAGMIASVFENAGTFWGMITGSTARKNAEADINSTASHGNASTIRSMSTEQRQRWLTYKDVNNVTATGSSGTTSLNEFLAQDTGGGGFQINSSAISNVGDRRASPESLIYTPTGYDDNYIKSSSPSVSSNHRPSLTPGLRIAPGASISGMNPKMMGKFRAMAKNFYTNTGGGYITINSAKRQGSGSVHNKGYAIDANAYAPNGSKYTNMAKNLDGTTRDNTGYIPESYLQSAGLHRPLLQYSSYDGSKSDEGWHIEPFPGADTYGGARNSLAGGGQPYRKGVLLAGGDGYAGDTGGGGFNLPQGSVERSVNSTTPINVSLTNEDINALALAFGVQIKKNTPVQENIVVQSNNATSRGNL